MGDLATIRTMKFDPDASSGLSDTARMNREALIIAFTRTDAHQTGKLFDLLDPDVVAHEAASLPYAGTYNGISGAHELLQKLLAAWSELHIEVCDILVAGDRAIVYHQARMKSRSTGEWFEGPIAEFFRFRNGMIIEWRPIYWDTHRVREICEVR